MEYKYPTFEPKYLIFIHVIRFKDILLEEMTSNVADTIFSKFGIPNASSLDKEKLKSYYIALVKKHHPDAGGSNENMRYINAAYDTLKTAEPPDTSEPADLWGGRSMPKNPKTKGALRPVNVEIRLEEDESVITYGVFDYYDLMNVIKAIETYKADISFDPLDPLNPKTGEWVSNKIIMYVNCLGMNRYDKDTLKMAIRKFARKFSSKGKSA